MAIDRPRSNDLIRAAFIRGMMAGRDRINRSRQPHRPAHRPLDAFNPDAKSAVERQYERDYVDERGFERPTGPKPFGFTGELPPLRRAVTGAERVERYRRTQYPKRPGR